MPVENLVDLILSNTILSKGLFFFHVLSYANFFKK